MAETTIEWTRGPNGEQGYTFNGWEGCQDASPGCANCYAKARNARFSGGVAHNWGTHAPRRRTSVENWKNPKRWNKKAKRLGLRYRVFCASLSDWLDNAVEIEWLVDLLALIKDTDSLDWLLLTKRIGNWRTRLTDALETCSTSEGLTRWPGLNDWIAKWLDGSAPSHVWLGSSIVNQEEADRDIPKLMGVPAVRRFLSMEPLLDLVNLKKHLRPWPGYCQTCGSELTPPTATSCKACGCSDHDEEAPPPRRFARPDWIIVGFESGPHARPGHPDWARSLRDQCIECGVPFFFKQWGEWAPAEVIAGGDLGRELRRGTVRHLHAPGNPEGHYRKGDVYVRRIGKEAAGSLLDGRIWNQVPQSAA